MTSTDIMTGKDDDTWERRDVREQNTDLLIQIAELCRRSKRSNPEVLFLLGNSGVGKSALINTIIKALTGRYYPRAMTGKGITSSKTLTLQRYEKCGIEASDIVDETHKDIISRVLRKLPTIYDAAGKGDVDTPELREILETLLRGCIPPGTSIESLEKKQKEYGIGSLKEIYPESNPKWKVTKVIFVQGCKTAIPRNLIRCLDSVLRKDDPKTGMLLCPCDVFVVITKYDLVENQHTHRPQNLDETITMERFAEIETAVATAFSIEGAMDHNSIRWVSYVDGQGKDNPHIDNIALDFILKMLTSGTVKPDTNQAKPLNIPHKKLKMKKWGRKLNICLSILVVVIAVFLYNMYQLLHAPVNYGGYNHHRRY